MTMLWTPSAQRIADSHLCRFMECINARRGTVLSRYEDLYAWSIEAPAEFWRELARFADVRASWNDGPVVENPEQMPGARFFPRATLNFAENLLRFRDDEPAIVFRNETGARRELSYRQLSREVARVAAGLAAVGVVKGDRVAGFLPNLPETVIAMLATVSLGAIWSGCSPDLGVNGVLDRFGQIEPKVMFAADGYIYAGKSLDSLGATGEVLSRISSIEKVVIVPYLSSHPQLAALGSRAAVAQLWGEFGDAEAALVFVATEFNHPLYILYSSGTTGAPKCIVHGAGGTLLAHQKEHLLHTDVRRSDRVFYFTTCGWMMWNWLVSALATGTTIFLYEGSPFHPDPGTLWRMAAQEKLTIMGVSAKFIASIEKSSFTPIDSVDLSSLRTILSTGSPLLPETFDYVYQSIKSDVQLASISGGTDIVSCFVLGCPIRPVHRGEIQSRGLAMQVQIFNENGEPVYGERGELVCTAPFPSMPLAFWNDHDGSKYRAAYFERFPGVWHHGDYAVLTEHDGIVIQGRSDAVLNPRGMRIGTAEIYSAVEELDEVIEALAVAQDWRGDVRIVLFVRLKTGVTLDNALRKRIRDTIRSQRTAWHVPAKILSVTDIPRTFSGKITELAVRSVIHDRPVNNIEALANPEALELFKDLPELDT